MKHSISIYSHCCSYWLIHRADYQKLLYDAAVELGAKVILNARVDKVDDATTTVFLENGDTFKGDLIVGADGMCMIKSMLI